MIGSISGDKKIKRNKRKKERKKERKEKKRKKNIVFWCRTDSIGLPGVVEVIGSTMSELHKI